MGDCVKYWAWLSCCVHELIVPVVTCIRTVGHEATKFNQDGKLV